MMIMIITILGVVPLPWQGGGGLAGSLKPYSSLGTGERITIITITKTIAMVLLSQIKLISGSKEDNSFFIIIILAFMIMILIITIFIIISIMIMITVT